MATATADNVVHVNFVERRRCPPRGTSYKATRTIAFGVYACTGPRCTRRVILPGSDHWAFSSIDGKFFRRCLSCERDGL